MRFYHYISAEKVRMLYEQLPPELSKGISGEFKINVGILSQSIKSDPQESTVPLEKKLQKIEEYLSNNDMIGDPTEKRQWLSSQCLTKYDISVGSEKDDGLVIFVGKDTKPQVILLGSASSLVGYPSSEKNNHSINYYTTSFISNALSEFKENSKLTHEDIFLEKAQYLKKEIVSPYANLAWVAKPLVVSEKIVFATPLYVYEV